MTKPALVQPTPTPERPAIVRLDGEGKRMQPPLGIQVVKVSGAETGGALEMIDVSVVPHAGPPLHIHEGFDEAFHVLEGTLTVSIDGRLMDLGPGATAMAPAGMPHTYKNRTERIVRFLNITAPGGMEELLEELAARPHATPEEMTRLAKKYGTLIVGPPLDG